MATHGLKVATGFAMGGLIKPERREPCDCEGCTANRFAMCEQIEQQIEAKRKAGKKCPPVMPPRNAPSTTRLQ